MKDDYSLISNVFRIPNIEFLSTQKMSMLS